MIIGKYIKQLLEERKRVILPGFGNLELKETTQGVSATGGRIDPPGLAIRFDAGYSKDDGLLAEAYASGENINEEKSQQRVLELVDSIKFALDKGEPFTLPYTGIFSRDDDGKVHVQPDPEWVLEPDQYGLESMDLLELEEEPESQPSPLIKAPEKSEDAGPLPEPPPKPAVKPEKKQPVPPPPPPVRSSPAVTPLHPPDKASPRFNRWKVIWIVAGSLIVILIALILIPVDWNQFQNGERGAGETEAVKVESEKEHGEVTGGTDPAGEADQGNEQTGEGTGGDEPGVEESGKTTTTTAAEKHNFFIIAGSFKHLKNASDLQDKLKARGYPAEVMITENRMYRVTVSSYATKPEAERALGGIKAEPGLEASWLLSN